MNRACHFARRRGAAKTQFATTGEDSQRVAIRRPLWLIPRIPITSRTSRSFTRTTWSEHRNLVSRRLHFVGSLGVIGCLAMALATGDWLWLPAAVVCGYGFAWVGHFFFEKNRPATFRHPLYSLMGDWVMFKDICVGKISL